MSNKIPYTLTNESINVIWEGKPNTIPKSAPNFAPLREALLAGDWNKVPGLLTVQAAVEDWTSGHFKREGDGFTFKGEVLPEEFSRRIVEMLKAGEPPSPMFRFWEKLQQNPSFRSVKQLWPFLANRGIPLTPDGSFLAYKGVRRDYKDCHSGHFDNSPGAINEMPRNQISDDPKVACHEGFHVGALEYAQSFSVGGRVVVCKVNPKDVVCVPYDHSHQKMRVCRYKVVGNHGSKLPDHLLDESEDEAIMAVSTPPAVGAALAIFKRQSKEEDDARVAPRGKWAKFDEMDVVELMNESVTKLRAYASKGLYIIGAGRLPGGKTSLVQAILQTRYDREDTESS